MTALTTDRNTARAERGNIKSVPLAAATKVFAGSMVCRNLAGNLVRGATGLGLIAVGRANEQVDNSSGAAGDLFAKVEQGDFVWANSSTTDLITIADIGARCYIVDDQTVARTSGGGTRSPAGRVLGVDAKGVLVRTDDEVLGAGLYLSQARVVTLVGAGVYWAIAPFSGRISRIWSILEGVLTTGNATLTGKIGATAITGGVVTHVQAGSAAGDVATAEPTALNVVAQGDKLSVTVGGTNASATPANVYFEIERR